MRNRGLVVQQLGFIHVDLQYGRMLQTHERMDSLELSDTFVSEISALTSLTRLQESQQHDNSAPKPE